MKCPNRKFTYTMKCDRFDSSSDIETTEEFMDCIGKECAGWTKNGRIILGRGYPKGELLSAYFDGEYDKSKLPPFCTVCNNWIDQGGQG